MKEEAFLAWVKTTSGDEPTVTIEKRPRPKTTAGKDEQGEVIREGAFIGWDGETVDFAPREFLPATVRHEYEVSDWYGFLPQFMDPEAEMLIREGLGGELKAELVVDPDGKALYINFSLLKEVAE